MNLEDLYRLMRVAHVQAQGIVDTVREPLLVLDGKLCVQAASRSFFEVFRVGRDETLGHHLYELGDRQWDVPELRRRHRQLGSRPDGELGWIVESRGYATALAPVTSAQIAKAWARAARYSAAVT